MPGQTVSHNGLKLRGELHPRSKTVEHLLRHALRSTLILLISLGSIARADVTPSGTYTVTIPIAVPPAPGAPNVSLQYNSASPFGLAGAGWDLSVGWPTLIVRDSRFGTPAWNDKDTWILGGTPLALVPSDSGTCAGQASGTNAYRTAPDSQVAVCMNVRPSTPSAQAVFPSGLVLTFEPIIYDGNQYPAAPSGNQTNVFGFMLRSAQDPNGYLTCFVNKQLGGNTPGRMPVLAEIQYGPAIKSCDQLSTSSGAFHHVKFDYVDPTAACGGSCSYRYAPPYFSPTSFRMGAPVSYNNLLVQISTLVASSSGAPAGQFIYQLEYYDSASTETRRPLLQAVRQQTNLSAISSTDRILRYFSYGKRLGQFNPVAQILEVGPDANAFPPSLSGSTTRAVLQQNPGAAASLFQLGFDQNDSAAPVSFATLETWSLLDINGDGMLDTVRSLESGSGNNWNTYEYSANPGPPPLSQQWALINEGITNGKQISSRIELQASAPALKSTYHPLMSAGSDRSTWIWEEGLGMTRTGMPVSLSSAEVRGHGDCQALVPGSLGSNDTRKWPYLPDGSFGGSSGSVGESLATASVTDFGFYHDVVQKVLQIADAYVPRQSVSASVSNWIDINADGVPDWIVTPGLIQNFDYPSPCNAPPTVKTFAVTPHFTDANWYVASGSVDAFSPGKPAIYSAVAKGGPTAVGPFGPLPGLPLSFSDDSNAANMFGFTLPIGSILAHPSAILSPSVEGVMSLVADALTPRGRPGFGQVSLSAPSAQWLMQQTLQSPSPADLTAGIGSFLASSLGASALDFTIVSAANDGRNQSRAELMDFNGDGYPDYLLYDTTGIEDPHGTSRPTGQGDVLLFLNNGKGGFDAPKRINNGFDYPATIMPNVRAISLDADQAATAFQWAQLNYVVCAAAPLGTPARAYLCGLQWGFSEAVATKARAAAGWAKPFLSTSTDALPGDRAHVYEAELFFWAITAASITTYAEPDITAILATGANTSARLLADAVKQLAFPSRINLLAKGKSRVEPAVIGFPTSGYSLETAGLVDLNGDGLPDYVVSNDRDKATCGDNQWEVYWGTGTSNISDERGFTDTPACIDVPASPVSLGLPTIPLELELTIPYTPVAAPGTKSETDTNGYSIVTLLDFNQDGRPDLVVAGGKLNSSTGACIPYNGHYPWTQGNCWLVYLNNGRGFDLNRPLSINGVTADMPGSGPANCIGCSGLSTFKVNFPALKSSYSREVLLNPVQVQSRSSSSIDAALIDVDGDGTAGIAQRVWFGGPLTGGNTTYKAGILFWSRQGNGPQDLLIEDRDPLAGSRVLVSYLPSPRFQWPNGISDGNPPPRGHTSALGQTAFLVSSIVTEPQLGRATHRTTTGFDYKSPFFDLNERAFTGYASVTQMALDPQNKVPVSASTSTSTLFPQRTGARNGATHIRTFETAFAAPVSEVHQTYEDVQTAGAANGSGYQAWLSKPSDIINVEFPAGLKFPAILDVSFDGRAPLANHGCHESPPESTSPPDQQQFSFDPKLPTGGGLSLDQSSSQQWIEYSLGCPNVVAIPNGLQQLTIELWINPTSAGVFETIIADDQAGYSLSLDSAGELVFMLNSYYRGPTTLNGGLLPQGQWSHVVAGYDGNVARIFVNTVLAAQVSAPNAEDAAGSNVYIGCGFDIASRQTKNCFTGLLGELRIYPEGWTSPPRITRSHTTHDMSVSGHHLGMPVGISDYGDIATATDDVFQTITYADPVAGSESQIQDAVSKTLRSTVLPSNQQCYLGYSATNYDSQPLGVVVHGNPTLHNVYFKDSCFDYSAHRPPIGTLASTTIDYDATCPGRATTIHEPPTEASPLGAVTRTSYDLTTCTFPLSTTNDLGHTIYTDYFGVAGVGFQDPNGFCAGGTGYNCAVQGLYGQPKRTIDANGGSTLYDYDIFGRLHRTVGPLDTVTRPGAQNLYDDAHCDSGDGSCGIATSSVLWSPPQVAEFLWDDAQHKYRATYRFADGQTQAAAVNGAGNNDWVVSGTRDFDVLGRIVTTYKPRYLLLTPCSSPPDGIELGAWCGPNSGPNSSTAGGVDSLRDPSAVAHIQTAYDDRNRVVRVYGADVPACADPSLVVAGNLLCDSGAVVGTHFTKFDYPAPGQARSTNALGVPTVVQTDARGRTSRVEEYKTSSPRPYSTVDNKYDADGHLLTSTDIQGNISSAIYDALGKRLSTTDPDMGTWSFSYDARGQLTTQTDAAGGTTENKYDSLGRLTKTKYVKTGSVSNFLNYTFDGSSADSETTNPITFSPQSSSNLWRVGPQVLNQQQFTPVPYKWEVALFTQLPLSAGDQYGGVATLALPFNFVLTPNADFCQGTFTPVTNCFGESVWTVTQGSQIFINTNGKIRFDPEGSSDTTTASGFNTTLPTLKPGTSVADVQVGLYPFWTQLYLSGGISTALVGSQPSRHLIIQWDGQYAGSPNSRVLFRVVLYEGTNEVQFQYNTLSQGSAAATIGLQNKFGFERFAGANAGLTTFGATSLYSFNRPTVTSGQGLSSLQELPNVLQFNSNGSYGVGQATTGSAIFDVDLTDATEATLSFRNSWNTRCAPDPFFVSSSSSAALCPIDHMEVDVDAGSGPESLLGEGDLTQYTAWNTGGTDIGSAPLVSAQFPKDAMGHNVKVIFSFSSLDNGTLDAAYGWMVDDINVSKKTGTLEDEVDRTYDSAELASSYQDSQPVLDITFDVPGRFEDRSPIHSTSTIRTVNVVGCDPRRKPCPAGISGQAANFGPESTIYVTNTFPSLAHSLTVEMWVNPDDVVQATNLSRDLIFQERSFALKLEPAGYLGCYLSRSGGVGWESAMSSVKVPSGTWTHVAMTQNGRKLLCFVDGVSVGKDLPEQLADFRGPILIGGKTSDSLPYVGLIDEVRVFSKARTSDQIISDMMSPLRHGPPRGNVLDLRFSTAGRFLTDESGSNNNAAPALIGGSTLPIMLPGVEGNAASFSAVPSEFVRVPNSNSLMSDLLTAEAWVKTTTTAEALLVGKWHGPPNLGWRLLMNRGSGQVRFEIRSTNPCQTSDGTCSFVTLPKINDGEWHQVTGVYDGTKLMVYIDGLPVPRTCTGIEGSDAGTCVPPPPDKCSTDQTTNGDHTYGNAVCAAGSITNNYDVYVGDYDPAYRQGFLSLKGVLDEVRVSNYAKRDFEVAGSAKLYSAYSQVLGQQVEMRNRAEAENSSYDILGRETTNHKSIDGGPYLARMALDSFGRTESLRYPDGEVAVSTFDRGGTETSLTGYGNFSGSGAYGQQAYLSASGVNVVGRLTYLQFGNNVRTDFTYNDQPAQGGSGGSGTFGDELLKKIKVTAPGGTLQDQQYTYDPVGNLKVRQDQATALHGNPFSGNYWYDDLNRLTSFQAAFGNSQLPNDNYSYDPLGNLTTKEGLTLSYGLASGASNCGRPLAVSIPHAVTSTSFGVQSKQYCYDADGRLSQVGVPAASGPILTEETLSHGVTGKLTQLDQPLIGHTFQFSYDGNGRRVKKVEPGRTTIEPFRFYRVTRASEKYYFTGRRRIARRLGSEVFWYHPDHLGSTDIMTKLDGNEVQDAYSEYYPYGGALPNAANNTSGNYSGENTPDVMIDSSGGFQYTGKEIDVSRVYYYGSRYYDPQIGRFLEPDTVTPGSFPQAMNRYSYVYNRPTEYVDPTGSTPFEYDVQDPEGQEVAAEIPSSTNTASPQSNVFVTCQSCTGTLLGGELHLGPAGLSPPAAWPAFMSKQELPDPEQVTAISDTPSQSIHQFGNLRISGIRIRETGAGGPDLGRSIYLGSVGAESPLDPLGKSIEEFAQPWSLLKAYVAVPIIMTGGVIADRSLDMFFIRGTEFWERSLLDPYMGPWSYFADVPSFKFHLASAPFDQNWGVSKHLWYNVIVPLLGEELNKPNWVLDSLKLLLPLGVDPLNLLPPVRSKAFQANGPQQSNPGYPGP